MAETNSTILEFWPAIRDDLRNFLSDTDAWIIAEIKKAQEAQDWERVLKLIDVMSTVHTISHSHQ